MSADDARHGTNAGYIAGCREQCCRDAHAAYKRALWRRRYRRRTSALYVDATGSQRRIRALQALGWTFRDVNRAAGWATEHPGGNAANVFKQNQVHLDTAERIQAVYDALSMKLGDGPQATRQQNIARARGWLPPLAWDDERIDDPTHEPTSSRRRTSTKYDVDEAVVLRALSGEKIRTNVAEREEILRRWCEAGGSARQMCLQMGWRQGRYDNSVRRIGDANSPEQEAS